MADLYERLAEAYSQPSSGYQALEAALGAVKKTGEGLDAYDKRKEEERKRKLMGSPLRDILGGSVQGLPDNLSNLDIGTVKELGGLDALAKFGTSPGVSQDRIDARARAGQEAQDIRQDKRFRFLREMVGAKGNRDAVNSTRAAIEGLRTVDKLWTEMGKLSELERAGAGTPVIDRLFPVIKKLKADLTRTAGFSEGGKNLTGYEIGVIVDSFSPTTTDVLDPRVSAIKKQTAEDFFSGTIDLYEAARLLGPAGAKLKEIADARKRRDSMVDAMVNQEEGGGSEIDAIFGAEGL